MVYIILTKILKLLSLTKHLNTMKGFFICGCLSLLFYFSSFAQDSTRWSRPSFINGVSYFFPDLHNFNTQLSNYGYPNLSNYAFEYELGAMTISPNRQWRVESIIEIGFQNNPNNANYTNKIKMNSWGGYGGLGYDLLPNNYNSHLFPFLNLGIRSRTLDFYKGTNTGNTINNVLAGNVQYTNVNYENLIIDLGVGFETNWGIKRSIGFTGFKFGYRFEIQEPSNSDYAIYTIPNTNFGGWFITVITRYQAKRKFYSK